MIVRNLLLLSFLFLAGCSDSQTPITGISIVDCEDSGYVNVQEWRKEILHLDSVKFNNEPFLINSFEYFKDLFGNKVYSYPIKDEDISIYGAAQNEKIRHVFNGVIVDQVENQAVINTLDFSKLNGHLDAKGLILKNGTKVAEVCKVYPSSCRLISTNGNLWSGFIELKIHQSGLDFRRMFLIFQKEKLKKLKIVALGY